MKYYDRVKANWLSWNGPEQAWLRHGKAPAANHLFKIREGSVPIEKEKADSFHEIVMQLQYLSQQGRCSISVNKVEAMCGLQYHSCTSGLAHEMKMAMKSQHATSGPYSR